MSASSPIGSSKTNAISHLHVKKTRVCPRSCAPEDAQGVPAVAADLLPEAGGVPDVLDGQVHLLKPALAVQRAQRLLAGRNQILVLALACRQGARPQMEVKGVKGVKWMSGTCPCPCLDQGKNTGEM